ncbi:AAA family ATPase [Niabella aquatica]
METLLVKNFGPIRNANIKLADFTIFSGVNAIGKGLLLQLLKLIIDRNSVSETLTLNNYQWGKSKNKFLELYFGEAMSFIWNEKTKIRFNNEPFNIASIVNEALPSGKKSIKEKLFYVPAQRVVTMAQGWPLAYQTRATGDTSANNRIVLDILLTK